MESYINKDLYGQSSEEFQETITNDFVGDNFEEQLEWAMLMIQGKFKQMRITSGIPELTINHFDKAYLLTDGLNNNVRFFSPLTHDLQASPDIFPLINIKYMMIGETIQLNRIKEMDVVAKRKLHSRRKYAYEMSTAFYKKDTESFYGIKYGYEVNPSFFRNNAKENGLSTDDIAYPLSLNPSYRALPDDKEAMIETYLRIRMAYQLALSMYYEWCLYIKEYDNIGLVIPVESSLLPELYNTSISHFEDRKRMIHFVKQHYRRKPRIQDDDYSVYVNRYLRGEHKFDYRSFSTEIIPPKYELNRVKTRKKFVDPIS